MIGPKPERLPVEINNTGRYEYEYVQCPMTKEKAMVQVKCTKCEHLQVARMEFVTCCYERHRWYDQLERERKEDDKRRVARSEHKRRERMRNIAVGRYGIER